MRNSRFLSRQEWLNNNGFILDPFEKDDFRAETDRWLRSLDFSAYWDRDNVGSLMGTIDFPGYRFIFSSEGGGKSSIGKRIHFQNEEFSPLNSNPAALVLDYADHTYPTDSIQLHDHVRRIIQLSELALRKNLHQEKKLIRKSPYQALKKLVTRVQDECGYTGVFLLVDNIDGLSLHKIKSLVASAQQWKLRGFITKFFLPQKLMLAANSELRLENSPYHLLEWTKKELLSTLNLRLITCMDPGLRDRIVQPLSLLSKSEMTISIVDAFLKLGELANNPRIMWQFGNYLLEEHTLHSNLGIKTTDLIGSDALSRAYKRLLDDLQEARMVIRPDDTIFDKDHVAQSRWISRFTTGSRLKVFLCYEKRYEKEIEDDLYLKLVSRNYEPWMFHKNILPGQNRDVEIRKSIRESDVFLLCLSSTSSSEVGDFHKALKVAKSKQESLSPSHTFIIPLHLDSAEISADYAELDRQPIEWFVEDQKIKLFYALERIQKMQKENARQKNS